MIIPSLIDTDKLSSQPQRGYIKNILRRFLHFLIYQLFHILTILDITTYARCYISIGVHYHGTKGEMYMSFYAAQVGEVIIKPQNRQDFGRFFCEDYGSIEDKALLCFVENWITDKDVFFTPLCKWQHNDAKEEWQGKYATTYNVQTGRFSYGVCYSFKSKRLAMADFFKLLQQMSQEVIFEDYINDFMIDEEVNE